MRASGKCLHTVPYDDLPGDIADPVVGFLPVHLAENPANRHLCHGGKIHVVGGEVMGEILPVLRPLWEMMK